MTKSQKLKGLAPSLAAILSIVMFFSLTSKPERSQSWAMIKSAAAISVFDNDKYEAQYYNDNNRLVVMSGSALLRDYDAEIATLVTAGKMVLRQCVVLYFMDAPLLSLESFGNAPGKHTRR